MVLLKGSSIDDKSTFCFIKSDSGLKSERSQSGGNFTKTNTELEEARITSRIYTMSAFKNFSMNQKN